MAEYAEANLHPGTVWKYREELSDKVLRTAVEWELIERNPCDNVRPAAAQTMGSFMAQAL